MTDNGFGARANSADSELWINKVRVDFGSGANGAVTLLGGFGLSDPKGYIPWKIVCDQIKGTALPDFDFNKLPTMDTAAQPAVRRQGPAQAHRFRLRPRVDADRC